MADPTTPVLKPKWQLILGLLPSLNSSIVAIVAAALSVASTLAVQHYKAPEAKPVVSALVGTDEVIHRLNLIEGHASLCVDGIMALRSEFKTPAAKGLPSTQSAAAKSPAVRVEGLPAAKAVPARTVK